MFFSSRVPQRALQEEYDGVKMWYDRKKGRLISAWFDGSNHTRAHHAYCACSLSTPRARFLRELNIPYSRKIWRGIKFGGLAVCVKTAKLKSAKFFYAYMYVWRYRTIPPNLIPIMVLKTSFWAKPPNLMTANISGYTVMRDLRMFGFPLRYGSQLARVPHAGLCFEVNGSVHGTNGCQDGK